MHFFHLCCKNMNLIYFSAALIICSTIPFQYISIFFVARKALIRLLLSDVNNEDISSSLKSFLRELKIEKTYFSIVFLCILWYLPIAIIVRTWQHFSSSEFFLRNTECLDTLEHFGHCTVRNERDLQLLDFWGIKELRKHRIGDVTNCFVLDLC